MEAKEKKYEYSKIKQLKLKMIANIGITQTLSTERLGI